MRESNLNTPMPNQSALAFARDLVLPSRQAMLSRAPSVQQFWTDNQSSLVAAWQEWQPLASPMALDESLLHPDLKQAVEQTWQSPEMEPQVRALWQEVSDGVYQAPFFDPKRLAELRDYLEQVADAGIPLRPPYGIVLNRRGAMLDSRSEGYLAEPGFQKFYRQLMDKYMRPIARMLFPEIVGYDTQTFGFSIQYQAGMDTSLRLHTDASSVTLNINLNAPDEHYTGSEVDFLDSKTGQVNRVRFEPGVAMIHRGNVAHAAHPIQSGTRSNFVFWLYGDGGVIPLKGIQVPVISAKERWSIPETKADHVAPF